MISFEAFIQLLISVVVSYLSIAVTLKTAEKTANPQSRVRKYKKAFLAFTIFFAFLLLIILLLYFISSAPKTVNDILEFIYDIFDIVIGFDHLKIIANNGLTSVFVSGIPGCIMAYISVFAWFILSRKKYLPSKITTSEEINEVVEGVLTGLFFSIRIALLFLAFILVFQIPYVISIVLYERLSSFLSIFYLCIIHLFLSLLFARFISELFKVE